MILNSGLIGNLTEFSKKPLDARTSPGYNREDTSQRGGIGIHRRFKISRLLALRVRVSPLVPNTTGEQMRNVVMLAAALMMGCGDEEGDSASDTAAAEDTAAE